MHYCTFFIIMCGCVCVFVCAFVCSKMCVSVFLFCCVEQEATEGVVMILVVT